MAPSRLIPHAVFSFLEISRQWQGRGFHRIASHVLQVQTIGKFKSLAFHEYSPEFPHKKGIVDNAGRPSGHHWYVAIMDSSRNHGPGAQQEKHPYEADSCFGKVIRGFDDDVHRRKQRQFYLLLRISIVVDLLWDNIALKQCG
jgi:hypothetical protein